MPLTAYSVEAILGRVAWTVEVTSQFESWWDRLTEDERVSIDGTIHVLEAHGPSLGAPYSVPVTTSRHAPHLRQLLVPHQDRQICVLYIPDERRTRLVLLTGTTSGAGSETCPPEDVARADVIYGEVLARSEARH
jgi:hypothetical protein